MNPMSLTKEHPELPTPLSGDKQAWKQAANCKGKGKLFFALQAERPQARTRREAKAHRLCTECVVTETCKSYARDSHEYGYWGGESEEDRHLAGFTVLAPIGIRAREARF